MITLGRWEPIPEEPQRMRYMGQRTAQEVFEELRQHLESMGYLPDEYFMLDADWENGREIPEKAGLFCTADYGESEGIYLDVYLKWYEPVSYTHLPTRLARRSQLSAAYTA